MQAQTMQEEAAITHTGCLLGRHCHCMQSMASTSAGSPAVTTAPKLLLSQNLALQFRLPSKQETVDCNIQNLNTERYQIYMHQGYSSDTTLITLVSVL